MMWLDTNNCDEHFHAIKKVDDKWIVLHSDGGECIEVEFGVADLVEG